MYDRSPQPAIPPRPLPPPGAPYPQQPPYPPYTMQPPRPPKPPMEPAKKKQIIRWCCIGAGVVALGVTAAIILPNILRVDYVATYNVAKTANNARSNMQRSDSCGGVMRYVTSEFHSKSEYAGYVSKCKEDMPVFKNAVTELAGTSGVLRDTEIRGAWEKFQSSYDAAFSSYEKLVDLYAVWHNFFAGVKEVTKDNDWWKSMNESKVQNLATPLLESGYEPFRAYGEGYVIVQWKQVRALQEYQKASDAYSAVSYSAPNKDALRSDMNSKREIRDGAIEDVREFAESIPDVKDTKGLVGVDLDKSENQFLALFSPVYSIISSRALDAKLEEFIGF